LAGRIVTAAWWLSARCVRRLAAGRYQLDPAIESDGIVQTRTASLRLH
jgi:hypothetical protein